MSMNAIQVITRDHRAIEEAYEDYRNAVDEDEKAAAASRILAMLDAHIRMEETYFHPAIQKQGKIEEGLVGEAEDELADMKSLLSVARVAEAEEEMDVAIEDLMREVSIHADEEVDVVLQAEKALSERELEELGKKMEPHSA
ncbi:MAG: hemerythrin domain-containing protein, partial [Patescibacteria group bacterium]|nr:hemerythrin domain-containing protein [Patescibacteria group bacterium]